eukprot:TRINITY_DN7085_c0_g4_i1.p1 TRINITY_DN7085_c0_g4~~TRINITY_DN7085_c0_g4_i1.p1  ORF type:complete len:560 (+),score=103.44 TRINITY_DN7085_c0_g4_i1:47-1726(+)
MALSMEESRDDQIPCVVELRLPSLGTSHQASFMLSISNMQKFTELLEVLLGDLAQCLEMFMLYMGCGQSTRMDDTPCEPAFSSSCKAAAPAVDAFVQVALPLAARLPLGDTMAEMKLQQLGTLIWEIEEALPQAKRILLRQRAKEKGPLLAKTVRLLQRLSKLGCDAGSSDCEASLDSGNVQLTRERVSSESNVSVSPRRSSTEGNVLPFLRAVSGGTENLSQDEFSGAASNGDPDLAVAGFSIHAVRQVRQQAHSLPKRGEPQLEHHQESDQWLTLGDLIDESQEAETGGTSSLPASVIAPRSSVDSPVRRVLTADEASMRQHAVQQCQQQHKVQQQQQRQRQRQQQQQQQQDWPPPLQNRLHVKKSETQRVAAASPSSFECSEPASLPATGESLPVKRCQRRLITTPLAPPVVQPSAAVLDLDLLDGPSGATVQILPSDVKSLALHARNLSPASALSGSMSPRSQASDADEEMPVPGRMPTLLPIQRTLRKLRCLTTLGASAVQTGSSGDNVQVYEERSSSSTADGNTPTSPVSPPKGPRMLKPAPVRRGGPGAWRE